MEGKRGHILLKDLEVYKLARDLSRMAWDIYPKLDWQAKRTIGEQFLEATDSVGANIAEGYSRFHFLEKIKFFYNASASLAEAFEHWLELLKERGKINEEAYRAYADTAKTLSLKLQNFISAVHKAKNKSKNIHKYQ
jgi:four helix bundle protein